MTWTKYSSVRMRRWVSRSTMFQKGVREPFPNAASTRGAFQTEMFSDPFFARPAPENRGQSRLLKPANLNLPDL